MDRSLEVPIAFLAIMKAGAAFAPVDMHWPARRIEGILSSMGSQVVLVGETTPRSNGFSHLCTTVSQEALAGMHDGPGVEASTVSPIYLLHTSGSSGEPKGVINIHQGIVNRLCYMTRRFGFQPEDTILQTSSHLFDASVWQLFWPLINGGATVIPGPGRTLNLDEVIELIDRERVSVTDFIPSIFDLLVQQLVQVPTLADRLRSLRQLLIGGEVLNAGSVRQFKALLPRVGITNTYGPTETSIGVIFHEVPADAKNPVPIGRPIDNVRCFILDDRLQLVPVGVAGTLYVGGACLGLGYLGNEQLTNEVFIPNPYPEVGSPRLYNTGDLARYLPDGNVEFLGRADQQVKLHGLRIELSEIEDVLSDFAGVEECAVVLRKQDAGPDRLVAYVVPAGGRALPPDEMRQWLRGHLPLIMVPSAFVMVEALPRLATGKVDRLGLPAPSRDEDAGARALDPPREPLEARLAGIWAEVLGLERVGIHENFFALGGSSLPSIEVVAQAKRAGYDLTPEMVFEYQTVAELAAVVRERSGVDVPALAGHQQVVNAATQTRPVDSPDAPARGNMLIESLGVYLPARAATLAEVVEGCDTKIRFPLGQLTGIRSMPRVEEAEFGLGLARKAILDCLSRSKFEAADIDLLISCSISRCNGPQRFTFEPSMATTLAHELGFSNALTFDVSNACAGLFTGLAVAQAFLRVGAVERALVVSGEYISHLAATAQREIEDRFMDPRLACLTLGDSGAALLLERAETSGVGFHALDLFTLGRYSLSCIAKATDAPHGGAILFNQPLTAAEARNTPAARHALETLSGAGWVPNSGEYVILHQTSGTTLQDVMRDVNKMLRVVALHEDNTINNLAERGNTATTSHFVALMDSIRSGRIKTGDRLVFGISGSGQALGTALYTLDDLPTRIENPEGPTGSVGRTRRRAGRSSGVPGLRTGVAIAGTGTLPQGFGRSESFVDLARAAAERCLNTSSQDRSQIDLVIHAGVYRKDFLSEPAMASIIAGELDINATMDSGYGRRTLAFDISNGPVGYLNACHVAVHMIRAGEAATALVVASEVENNARSFPQELLGVRETGSAMLLRQSPAAGSGFGGFLFKSFLDRFDAYASAATWRHGTVCLDFSRSPQLEDHYLDACSQTIDELLRREGLSLGEVSLVFPPQISAGFISALAQRLGTPRERFIDVTGDEPDLFTSSLPYAFEYVRDHDLIRPDDVGLLVSVGSGLQVGCALYYF
jgi:amino acid adenylation domain-containing protein